MDRQLESSYFFAKEIVNFSFKGRIRHASPWGNFLSLIMLQACSNSPSQIMSSSSQVKIQKQIRNTFPPFSQEVVPQSIVPPEINDFQ